MPLKGASPQQTQCFDRGLSGSHLGISFYLPSRRRFIPYSWLHYADLNQASTELYLHYTHAVVTITGRNLEELHEAVEHFQLRAVRELPSSSWQGQSPMVSRIEIAESASA
jgi:hypothetical protein